MFFSVVLVFVYTPFVSCLKSAQQEEKCLSFLPENYDLNSLLKNGEQPTYVYIQMEILDLDEINEETMDMRMHAFIRAVWNDSRLLPNRTNMSLDCLKYIWTPDLMFEEAKVIIETGQYNVYLKVQNDHIYLSQRYSFKIACMMNFQRYPFDTQHCKFSIAFMHTPDTEAVLKWFDDEQSPYRSKVPPIALTKEIDPLQFVIAPPNTYSLVKEFTLTNFSYLFVDFALSRRLTGTIVNYYMPSALLVVISWVTFWLKEDAASERVTLIMTALLTICTQCDQYKDELPPVNYITAMDIWFFVCIFMLFASLLEFAFSYNAFRKERERKSKKVREKKAKLASIFSEGASDATLETAGDDIAKRGNPGRLAKLILLKKTTKLDSICKLLFPAFFLTFFAIYWIYYLCIPV